MAQMTLGSQGARRAFISLPFRPSGSPVRFLSLRSRPLSKPFTSKPLITGVTQTAGGGGGGSRIGSGKGFGGGGEGGGGGQRRPLISLTLAYAIFVAVGGVMGYKKAGSRNSLLSSLAVAAGMAGSAYHMNTHPGSLAGVYAALVIAVALGGFMAYGWWKKRKAFPQGVTAALSLTLAAFYAIVVKGPDTV